VSYFVTCSFDLKSASAIDYQNAYADLARIGLRRTVVGGTTTVVAPTTMAMGEFNGANAASVRDALRRQVRAAFQARRLPAEIFVTVGGADWTWGSTTC
jgi:hypothetical protein